jgi:hypothetical protein
MAKINFTFRQDIILYFTPIKDKLYYPIPYQKIAIGPLEFNIIIDKRELVKLVNNRIVYAYTTKLQTPKRYTTFKTYGIMDDIYYIEIDESLFKVEQTNKEILEWLK